MKNKLSKWIIFLFFLSIFVLPRLFLNRVRLEDFIFPILIFMVIGWGIRSKFRLFNRYYLFVFIVTLIGFVQNYIPIQGFIIFIKELEYFIFGIFLFSVFADERLKQYSDRIILLIALATIGYGFYQLAGGIRAYYGIRAINELSPSLSAWTINILLFYLGSKGLVLRIKTRPLFIINTFLFILVAFVGSRTGIIVGLLFYLKFIIYNTNIKLTVPISIISLFILISIAPIFFPNFIRTFDRYDSFSNSANLEESFNPRKESFAWRNKNLENFETTYSYFFGFGRGFGNMDPDYGLREWRGFSMVVDSMYLRNYLEIGMLGSILFLLALVLTSFKFLDRSSAIIMLLAYLLSFFTMESWLISKPGFFFWLIIARFHKR